MIRPSRREFVGSVAGSFVAARAPSRQTAAAGPITAAELAERIRASIGVQWREKTVDGFKAGNPDIVVTGILTTVMATRGALARAVELRRNLVITQEPVFYGANDEPANRASDAVYVAKKAYIEQHGLVVYRFSDHWNARQPDPRVAALAGELGWPLPDAGGIVRVPETSFSNLLTHVRQRLAIRGGLRTIGSPAMRVRTLLLSPGTTDVPAVISRISAVDVVIAGEPREWEVVPYINDCREAGMNKALIAVGRLVSEAPGMKACAEWIKPLAPRLPVDAGAFDDPYWSPGA